MKPTLRDTWDQMLADLDGTWTCMFTEELVLISVVRKQLSSKVWKENKVPFTIP